MFAEGAERHKRRFVFSLATPAGISEETLEVVPADIEFHTSVRLMEFREEYETLVPSSAQAIAERIVEHCLEYFVWTRMPNHAIVRDLSGDDDTEVIALWDVYQQLVDRSGSNNSIAVGDQQFDLAHFFIHARAEMHHHLSYCAHNRVVMIDNLVGKVPNLPGRLVKSEGGEPQVYAGYVSSAYLDQHVNQQRTGFDSVVTGGFAFPGELDWSDVQKALSTGVADFLGKYTESTRVEKEAKIRTYVNESAPQYRHILERFPQHLDQIAPDATEEQIDSELYKISRDVEAEFVAAADKLIEEDEMEIGGESLDATIGKFADWWETVNDIGKSNLAKYIVHRSRILAFLERALKRNEDVGKYPKEQVIHEIIFPIRSSSDDVSYDKHNLWVIDEKLSYHTYLSSDRKIKQLKGVSSESDDRPDLVVFYGRPIALVEGEPPYSSVVVFEFKRPMRDDYTDNDNPITQVYRYAEEIRSGVAQTAAGRPITVPKDIPFYCYVIADLSPRLQEQARISGLHVTPDGAGYYGYNDAYGVYVEIISFDKLLQDAKKRNRVLFERLRLPSHI